ncbi:aprataxin and PNK-like factor [Salmo trutta]|uniref:Aprataxin and PNK-like factor n=1 Tax=Salmo trutta TaxID=8032 RepID=A0A674DYK8_SALTR|nr:aprataxin and PNK-like factor [Salmo trutta]XP_029596204.1 aprataxin and PNK-like factor [Salmo trutta]XP_029596205.1 aprataxin and PNK-like factor [Salmo trutta]
MTVPIAAPKSPTTTTTTKGAGNRGRVTATPSINTNQGTAKPSRDAAPLSREEESEHSEPEPTPRKRMRRKSDEDDVVQSKTAFKARQEVKPSKVGESEESDHSDVEEENDEEKRRRSFRSERQQHFYEQSEGQRVRGQRETASGMSTRGLGSSEVSGPAQSKAWLRTTCPFGKDCYRKNPVHFQECSHPGDYEDDSAKDEKAEEDADQPECPYGTDCYRKNPLHWKDYKHTKKTRAKKPVSYNNDDDEFGDDDSFINDESEDISEDSDYEPPDSDDSGKEDLKRLKEAKAFTNLK